MLPDPGFLWETQTFMHLLFLQSIKMYIILDLDHICILADIKQVIHLKLQ